MKDYLRVTIWRWLIVAILLALLILAMPVVVDSLFSDDPCGGAYPCFEYAPPHR